LLERFASHIERRDRAILKLLESNPSLSLDELATFGIIYPKSSLINNPALVFFEKKMLEKHLERQKIQFKATG